MLQGHTLPTPTSGIRFRRGPKKSGHETQRPSSVRPEPSRPQTEALLPRHRACGSRPAQEAAAQALPMCNHAKSWTEATVPEPLCSATVAMNSAHQTRSISQTVTTAAATDPYSGSLSPTFVVGQVSNSCHLQSLLQDAASVFPRQPKEPEAGALSSCA